MSTVNKIVVPPFRRLASHPLWARDAALTVQRRADAETKAADLWRLRLCAITDHRLTNTIIDTLRFLRHDEEINLLAMSICVELGGKIEDVRMPENIKGKKIYYAARLLILSGKDKEAEGLLINQPLVKHRILGFLMRDPNLAVRQTACAW